MNSSWTRKFTFVLAFVLLASVPAFAQGTVGSVSGTVTDPQGAVVPGATVTLVNNATGVTREATSSESGLFVFDRVRVGIYTLRVTMSGFKTHEQPVEVSAGKVSAVGELHLEVGRTEETVTITETATPLVQGDSPQIVGAYDARKVADINWGTFGLDATAYLTAGIVPGFGNINSNTGGFSGQMGGGGFAPAAAGQRSRSTQFAVDGHEINDISIGGPSIFMDNLDLVGEYQVTVNQFDAAGGRLPGAQINVITKSGTNELHGSLFYFYDANSLRAKTAEEDRFDLEKAKDISHQFGFTAGGPIIKNKWFVFGGHHRQRNPAGFQASTTSLAFTLPGTPGCITCNGATNMAADFGTNTTAVYVTRGPFAIPDGSPACSTTPQLVAVGAGMYEACGVTRLLPQNFFSWEATIKMDVVLSKQTFVGKYYDESEPFSIGSGGTAGYWVDVPFRAQSFSLNHTYQFSPRVLNDFRFSFGKFLVAFEGANTAPISRVRDNLTNINLPGGFIDLGLATNLPQGRLLYNFQWTDNVSIVRGRHTLKLGAEIRRNRTTAPFLPFVNGQFNYTSITNFANNVTGSTSFTEGPFSYQPFETDQFFYIQDDVRLRPNLTFNLGLRYEHTGQPANGIHEEILAREQGPGAFWNPAVALENRIFPKIDTDNNNWGPRIGFAYTPRFWKGLFGEDKTVIRGGYSVAYEAAFYNILLNISTSAPRVFFFTLSPGIGLPGDATGNSVAAALAPLIPAGTRDPREFNRTILPQDFASPTVQTWTIGFQREFGNNMVWELRYVGTKSTGQFQSINANPRFSRTGGLGFQDFPAFMNAASGAVPCTAADDPPTFLTANAVGRVFCDAGAVRSRVNGASSIYHGLQSRFDARNVWNQLTGGLSYQWGHSIDNVSEIFGFFGNGSPAFSQNPFDYRAAERGTSNYDLQHTFAAHWIWDAPWHRDQQGALGKIAGGWQFNGQWFYFSGRPWTAVEFFVSSNALCGRDTSFNTAFAGIFNTCRPFVADPSAPVHTVGFIGDPGVRWWVSDCSGALGCPLGPFGASRNLNRGDDTHLTNMSLFKNTRFGPEGRFNFQLRWSIVNVFNHRNFGVPDIFIDDSAFFLGADDAFFGLPERNNAVGRVNRLALRFTW